MKILNYINNLRKKANESECTDFNGDREKSFIKRNFRSLSCSLLAIFFIFTNLKQGISSNFEYYIFTILSIFIGLFITAIIFYLGVLTNQEKRLPSSLSLSIKEKEKENREVSFFVKDIDIVPATEKLSNKQRMNHGIQSVYILGYNVILCVLVIFVLFINLLFGEFLNVDTGEYIFTNNINVLTIATFFRLLLIYVIRFIIMGGLLNIMYNIVYIISSLVVVNTPSKK